MEIRPKNVDNRDYELLWYYVLEITMFCIDQDRIYSYFSNNLKVISQNVILEFYKTFIV